MGDTFDFSKALELLRQGKRVTRASKPPQFCLYILGRQISKQVIIEWPCEWVPNQFDILADDWMIADD